MKFLDFSKRFHEFKVFSVHDIRKANPGFDTRRLVEWQKKGYIRKIINRWYIFSDIELHEELLYYIANHIYAPSYISLESAFSYYHLIPEGVYSLTSVTSNKTNHFQTPVGTFSYRHVKPALMFGYRLLPFASTELLKRSIRMAEIEKALLDYFYLNPHLQTMEDVEGLRINQEELIEQINPDKLKQYLEVFDSKSLQKRITNLLPSVLHAEH